MKIRIALPLDSDGFLRRECPDCHGQFKWHNGPANEEAEHQSDPAAYSCPLCGTPAAPDAWLTQEQVDYARGVAAPAALLAAHSELEQAFRKASSKHLKFKTRGRIDLPEEPAPLTEPDDMTIIASPCHSYEPVKVPEALSGPFHCLVCGSRFAV